MTTGLVQPLDVAVNKPVKDILRDLLDDALELYQNRVGIDLRESTKVNAVAERRVIITKCVADAWEQFCTTRRPLIVQTFRNLGLSLPIDGTCDNELKIKGIALEDLKIGNWERLAGEKRQEIENWGEKAIIIGGSDDNDEPEVIGGAEETEILDHDDDNEGVDFVDRDGLDFCIA